jgi:low affinity Fe/Cu permease
MSEPDGGGGHVAEEPRGEQTAFSRLAGRIRSATGSAAAAAMVAGTAAVWVVVGVLIDYPRWWELLVTAGLPFVTLLMVVLLQYTQNHDDRATQLKLDELIRATHSATNRMMTVEEASPAHLDRIHEEFHTEAESAATSRDS